MARKRLLTIRRFDIAFFLAGLLIFAYSVNLFGLYGIAITVAAVWYMARLKKKDPDIYQVMLKSIKTRKVPLYFAPYQITGGEPARSAASRPEKSSRLKTIMRTIISAIKPRRESLDLG